MVPRLGVTPPVLANLSAITRCLTDGGAGVLVRGIFLGGVGGGGGADGGLANGGGGGARSRPCGASKT